MPLGRLGGRCLCRNWRESPVLAHECAPGASGWPMPVPKLEGITCFGTRMCPWGVWVADARAETACICQFWHTDVPLGRLGGRCPCRNRVYLPVLAHGCALGASGWPMPVPKLREIASFGTRICLWGVWVADACAETAWAPRRLPVPLPVIAKTGSYGKPPAWALRKAPPAAAVTGMLIRSLLGRLSYDRPIWISRLRTSRRSTPEGMPPKDP